MSRRKSHHAVQQKHSPFRPPLRQTYRCRAGKAALVHMGLQALTQGDWSVVHLVIQAIQAQVVAHE
jgi:hypothetical protein